VPKASMLTQSAADRIIERVFFILSFLLQSWYICILSQFQNHATTFVLGACKDHVKSYPFIGKG